MFVRVVSDAGWADCRFCAARLAAHLNSPAPFGAQSSDASLAYASSSSMTLASSVVFSASSLVWQARLQIVLYFDSLDIALSFLRCFLAQDALAMCRCCALLAREYEMDLTGVTAAVKWKGKHPKSTCSLDRAGSAPLTIGGEGVVLGTGGRTPTVVPGQRSGWGTCLSGGLLLVAALAPQRQWQP